MKISVWNRSLSDSYLTLVTQLGADCIDFSSEYDFPGVRETGRPDADGVLAIKRKVESCGLRINRVTLPEIPPEFMDGSNDDAIDRSVASLEIFARAGVPIASQRFSGAAFRGFTSRRQAAHRGGYLSRAESLVGGDASSRPTTEALAVWWERFLTVFDRLAPVARDAGIRITAHPSDSPVPDAPISGQGLSRLFDAFPGPELGCIYCCGTRAEAGGSPLVLDEIGAFGRRGKIFMVHFRNVRGSFATSGGFEEVLLDDGDMNMLQVLEALDRVGFSGCLNPDHYPLLEGDAGDVSHALAYSVGYLKALLLAIRS
jgi:mannonate dehydratase